jgi:TatA/E family protein of Tat protein translocase
MLNIGPQELIVVLIIALVVVGPNRLPELGRSIGRALREFRKIQDDVKDTIKFDLNDDREPYVAPRGQSPTVPADTPAVATDASGDGTAAVAPVEPDVDAPPRAAE